MNETFYQAVYLDKDGAFRVNGAIANNEADAISMCSSHKSVINGAKLHYIDSWVEWVD